MMISVTEMNDGNDDAGPDTEEQIGEVEIPISGTLVIGNHTYEQGFDQVEFKANILHEMGHILGIGSYTENFTEYSEEYQGNVLQEDKNRVLDNGKVLAPLTQ